MTYTVLPTLGLKTALLSFSFQAWEPHLQGAEMKTTLAAATAKCI